VTPEVQQKNLWCWNAVSQMVLRYFDSGTTATQVGIANWASGGHNVTNYLVGLRMETVSVPALPGVPAQEQQVFLRGIDRILWEFGDISSQFYNRPLARGELDDEIDAGRPVVYGLDWFTDQSKSVRYGGHYGIIKGKSGDTITVIDPWPMVGEFSLDYDDLVGAGSYRTGYTPHNWDESLTVAKAVDLTFLIDATYSMEEDLIAMKDQVDYLIGIVTGEFKDYRIAVVTYKDSPDSADADPGDYISQVHEGFRSGNAASAKAAIQSLGANGGGDFHEGLLSAIFDCLLGVQGDWREDPIRRVIVTIGDAPAHDPEPWSDGIDSEIVRALAEDPDLPIEIHTVYAGEDVDFKEFFELLSGKFGGKSQHSGGAAGIVDAISEILNFVKSAERFPSGQTPVSNPTFRFPAIDTGMMGGQLTPFIELQWKERETSSWLPFLEFELPVRATRYFLNSPLPVGEFRWRLKSSRLPGDTWLPNGEVYTNGGGDGYEVAWTYFERLANPPTGVAINSPNAYGFAPEIETVVLTERRRVQLTKKQRKKFRLASRKKKRKL